MMPNRFAVVQLGARMRYAVPRIFHEAGLLERFYTDLLATHGWPRIFHVVPKRLQPRAFRRLTSRGREIADFPSKRVQAFPVLGIRYALRRMRARDIHAINRIDIDVEEEFSRRVVQCGLGSAQHLYCFDAASLGVMRAVANTGVRIVMEQTIAPQAVMSELLQREREKHPGWEESDTSDGIDEILQVRCREAWTLADMVVCGSEFVREGIQHCGGPASKCAVVPYGVDLDDPQGRDPAWRRHLLKERYARRRAGAPLRVLTMGTVGLRKGSPYVEEAARTLGRRAQFRMVGSLSITEQAKQRLAAVLQLTGLVPRNEVAAHYEWADVFLLPSICEGSATVTYEALAQGLPVICTPNTGSVVTDGVDGLIVAASSGEAVIAALEKVMARPELWRTMARNALATSDRMDVKHYGERLLKAVGYADLTDLRI